MIHDLGLFWTITWVLLPYIVVISIIIVTIWMLIKWIPIWIKRWKDLDNEWWK
jgi:hypothetical protein